MAGRWLGTQSSAACRKSFFLNAINDNQKVVANKDALKYINITIKVDYVLFVKHGTKDNQPRVVAEIKFIRKKSWRRQGDAPEENFRMEVRKEERKKGNTK